MKFSATTEIKYRGPLSKLQAEKLIKYLKANLTNARVEHVFYLESTAFPSIGDFNWGAARMSIKRNGKSVHLRLKDGNAAAHERVKYDVKIANSQAANLFYILSRLGMKDAFYRPVFRQEYRHQNLHIMIKQKCVMGDHFEINLKKNTEASHAEFLLFLRKFKLHCWTESQYKSRIAEGMKKSPAIPILELLTYL